MKNFLKPFLITLTVTFLILGGAGLGIYSYYNKQVNDSLAEIKRDELKPAPAEELPKDPAAGQSLNLVLMGSDTRGLNDPGRSDSLMVVHVPSDRKAVYLISIPRDLKVEVPGQGTQKINAAYSWGGAPLTVTTVQNLLGVPIDHVALVDFKGFMNLIDTLGGVTIYNPHEGCDAGQNDYCWKKGKVDLNKEDALRYVRWRKGLPNGDIDRAQNQQRVLKAVFDKILSKGTLASPTTFSDTLHNLSQQVTVDKEWSPDEMKGLALNMDVSSSADVRSFVYPITGYEEHPVLGSLDIPDTARGEELATALKTDTVEAYWQLHKGDPVAGDATVKENP